MTQIIYDDINLYLSKNPEVTIYGDVKIIELYTDTETGERKIIVNDRDPFELDSKLHTFKPDYDTSEPLELPESYANRCYPRVEKYVCVNDIQTNITPIFIIICKMPPDKSSLDIHGCCGGLYSSILATKIFHLRTDEWCIANKLLAFSHL